MKSGFSALSLVILITFVAVAGFFAYKYVFSTGSPTSKALISKESTTENSTRSDFVTWEYSHNEQTWLPSETPPPCDVDLTFPSPVDLSLVSGILYPGQTRGSDYKPHGGFRFDGHVDTKIEVYAIMRGYIKKVARYDDGYAIQHQIFYINECGIMVMNDHILTLSPELEKVFNEHNVHVGRDGDSRTTEIHPPVYIEKGTLLATEVGYDYFPGGQDYKNIFVDFGLYDLRMQNTANFSDEFKKSNANVNEYGKYGLCWFEYLSEEDEAFVRSLPAGGVEGKVSDYCD